MPSDNLSDIFLYKEYNALSQMQCIEILAYGERKQREIDFQLVSENVSAKCNKWSQSFVLCGLHFVQIKK